MKINYLIAAAESPPRIRTDMSGFNGEDTLRVHLDQLAQTDTSQIAQVTLVKTDRQLDMGRKTSYYDIAVSSAKLKVPFVILPVADIAFSYSSWIQAFQKYGTSFDYYVLMEDDYYPAHYNFINMLLEEHRARLPSGGYLSSYCFGGAFGAVSNGIVDSPSFSRALNNTPNTMDFIRRAAQENFGRMFGINNADFTYSYRCLFWLEPRIIEETHNMGLNLKIDIFNPVQYLRLGESDFVKNCS